MLYFDDLTIGDTYTSPGRTITETDVVGFAGLSGDFSELHTNAHVMAGHAFGQRIAHGLLVLSIHIGLCQRAAPPTALLAFAGLGEWRFVRPVYLGDTVHAEVELVDKRRSRTRPDRGTVTQRRRIRNQHGEIVQEGTAVFLVAVDPDATVDPGVSDL